MLQVPQIYSTLDPCIKMTARDLRPVTLTKKRSVFFKLLKTVKTFVYHLFMQFSLKKASTPFAISTRQVQLIQQAKVDRTLPLEHSVQAIKRATVIQVEEDKVVDIPNPVHDDSLEKMKKFLVEFSQITVNDCTYEDILTPAFPEWKKGLLHLIQSIPEWNETFLKLKETASPLLARLNLKSIDDAAITLVIQQMLKQYVKIDQETVKKELLGKLQELWESETIDDAKYQQAKAYLNPMLKWLYHPNNWMVRSPQPVNLHHFFSDSIRFFDTLTLYIQEGGMNDFFKEASRFIEEDFENQIKQALELNTGKISLIVANRLADLIEDLPFTETFNQLLSHIVDHIEGWTDSEKVKNEQARLVVNAEKANKAHATNKGDIHTQKEYEELLGLVGRDGGKKQYLTNEFVRAFSKHPSCNQKISKMISAVDDADKEKIESKIFKDLIDKLMPNILPKSTYTLPHGLEVEVNGISDVIQNLSFPKELEALRKHGIDEFEKVLKNSSAKDKDNFRDYFFALTHIIMVEHIQSKLNEKIAEEVKKFFNRLAKKDYLNYLAAEYILPSLIDKTLEGFVRAYIERQPRRVAVYLHEMLETQTNVIEKDHALIEFLYEAIQKEVIDFDLDEAKIDRARFGEIVQPVITEMYEFITAKKDEHPTESLSLSDVRSCLRQYFKYDTVPVNHDYGKLIMNSLFKVGSYGGWVSEKLIGTFQGTLSSLTSQTLHPISKDHQILVDTVIEITAAKLRSVDAVRQNLFIDSLSEEELVKRNDEVKAKLPLQLRRISALTHDSVYHSLANRWVPFIKHGTPTTDKINDVMDSVFNKLLDNNNLNTSLLVSCTDIIQEALSKSAIEVDAHQSLQNRLALVESE